MPCDINYLRVSITDRCNLRCFYCTPWGGWEKLPAPEILRYEELLHLAGVAAGVGIRKVRVTGGEPLVRRGVVEFIRNLGQVPGHRRGLPDHQWSAACGAGPGAVCRRAAPPQPQPGHPAPGALSAPHRGRSPAAGAGGHQGRGGPGISPLKINCVVLKGANDDELLEFALLTRDHPFQVRFIEFMPTVSRERWQRHFLPMAEVRRRLRGLGPMAPVDRPATAGPARTFRIAGFQGELGFISSVSEHHCPSCNRLRLTAAGHLRPCLFVAPEIDVKGPLRRGADDQALGRLFREAMAMKKFKTQTGVCGDLFRGGAMVSIGG